SSANIQASTQPSRLAPKSIQLFRILPTPPPPRPEPPHPPPSACRAAPPPRRALNHRILRDAFVGRPQHHMRPRAIPTHFHAPAQIFANRIKQRRTMRRVPAPNPPQMPLIHSCRYKFRQRFLLQRCRVPVAQPLRSSKRRHQRLRRDQIPNPQCRKNRSRKRPHINHAPFAVQTLQRLQRLPLITNLAIVITLHHDRIFPPPPIQQRHPPRQRQNRASRE